MKITKHKLCQFIIKKYIKDNINWPREIKIAQKLLKSNSDYIFWNSLKEFKIPSLAWFLTGKGKEFLFIENKKFNFIIKDNNKVILAPKKIGEDKNICKKPKSVLEFIRYGKKT